MNVRRTENEKNEKMGEQNEVSLAVKTNWEKRVEGGLRNVSSGLPGQEGKGSWKSD